MSARALWLFSLSMAVFAGATMWRLHVVEQRLDGIEAARRGGR